MNSSYEVNINQLIEIAHALGNLLPEVTFVGGCTTALLVDESAYFGIRQTKDVDVIVDVTGYFEYQDFSEKLRRLGFTEDIEGPNCRWIWKGNVSEIQLDVMPTDKDALGFSNIWYPDAIKHARKISLDSNLKIDVVSPTYFLATKFEAFKGRGNGDYFSHDIEDIIFVLENSSEIINQILNAPLELKEYLAIQFTELKNDDFLNVLPGMLNNPDSSNAIENILKIISDRPWR
jgi:predicted nucleotidyltransferase